MPWKLHLGSPEQGPHRPFSARSGRAARGCWLTRAVAALLLGALLPLSTASAFRRGTGGTPTPVVPSGRPGPVTITWLESGPQHPALVFTGGYLGNPSLCVGQDGINCTLWAARSLDAGTRWTSLGDALGFVPQPYGIAYPVAAPVRNPFLLSPNGTDLYYGSLGDCGRNPDDWSWSPDRGQHWAPVTINPSDDNDATYYNTASTPGFSLAASHRLYINVLPYNTTGYAITIARSDDSGAHWRIVGTPEQTSLGGQPLGYPMVGALVGDPVSRDTVYLGVADLENAGCVPSMWARSEDGGATWHLISPPIKSAFNTFQIFTDRHLPHAIVAQITGDGIPADRRYLSTDHGRTWKPITCPGDWRGQCPAFILDNVFGSGHAYGFYRDGVRAFTGGGSAGPRLPLSLHLPCTLNTLIDAAGGGKAALLLCQDPKVALATGPNVVPGLRNNPNLSGLLYRSANAGRSWQRVTPEVSPPIPTAVPIQ